MILLAHRDEFTARPSAALHWWPDTDILAGRDEQAGGSWLGVTRHGRFAAVTNVRQGRPEASARSRGELVTDWLNSPELSIDHYAGQLAGAAQYSGFNLLFGGWLDGRWHLHYGSNRFPGQRVPDGISALSNGAFDAPWPKVRLARQRLAELLATGGEPTETWLDALADHQPAADAELPDTGIGLDRERWLSPLLITGAAYGTRAASLFTVRADGLLTLLERSLDPADGGRVQRVSRHQIQLV